MVIKETTWGSYDWSTFTSVPANSQIQWSLLISTLVWVKNNKQTNITQTNNRKTENKTSKKQNLILKLFY
jgi:hypothetical protein